MDAEAFKLRNIDNLDVITGDYGLGTHGEVPEMPDSHGLIAWKVRSDLGGQKPIHLPLALKLSSEGGLGYLC